MSQASLASLVGTTSGPSLRAMLTAMDAARISGNSGASRPSYATAGTWWLDTTADPAVWKYYDGATDIVTGYLHAASDLFMLPDSARVANTSDTTKRARFDASGITAGQTRVITLPNRNLNLGQIIDRVQTKSADYTVDPSDIGSVISVNANSAARTMALPPAASSLHMVIAFEKSDASFNAVTIDGDGSETINGAATLLLLRQYDSVTLICDGTGWRVISDCRQRRITLLAQNAGSTSVDFTLPAIGGIKEFAISILTLSTTGTVVPQVRIGDSGGLESSGYTGTVTTFAETPGITTDQLSAGIALTHSSGWAGGVTWSGSIVFQRNDAGGNVWSFHSQGARTDNDLAYLISGSKQLTAEIDRFSIVFPSGSDTFDNGVVGAQVQY